jgi:putative aminopeptidase FrvX
MFQLSTHDQHALASFLQDLVRIPSFSCQEQHVAERLAAEMRAVGFDEVWTDRIGNVVGRIGSRQRPPIALQRPYGHRRHRRPGRLDS